MTNLERRRKIFLSTPVTFLLYAVPFGFIMQMIGTRNPHPSLTLSAILGISFGIFMTISSKRRLQKFNQTTGLSDTKQQWTLHDTVRKGIIPRDPDILSVMPAYIEKRIKMNQSSRKYATAFLLLIGGVNILLAVVSHDLGQGLISVFLFAFAGYNYFITAKQAVKLDNLLKQLKSS